MPYDSDEADIRAAGRRSNAGEIKTTRYFRRYMIHERICSTTLLLVLLACCLFAAAIYAVFFRSELVAVAETAKADANLAKLAAEIDAIKTKLPDQGHAMQDVGYHFSNLWFAGQGVNWSLAQFYWKESQSHLHWAILLKPKRKDSAGKEIDLQAILQAIENVQLKQLEDAIKAQDKPAFVVAYRATLEMCYSCHKASDKPFLRPQIPTQPETPIINFDTEADWPK